MNNADFEISQHAMKALMQIKKIDIKTLQEA